MLLRTSVSLAFLLAALTPVAQAQETLGSTPFGAAAKPQDPDRPHPSAADQMEQLQREIERLKQEIDFVKGRATATSALLREKFAGRQLLTRTIDAGQNTAVAPTAAPPTTTQKHARVFNSVESEALGADVIMTVDGSPVTQGEIDAMVTYLMALPAGGDKTVAQQRAMMEAIRIHTLLAAFPESAAEARSHAKAALEELHKGAEFGDVLGRYGSGPNMTQEGRVQITHMCPFGLQVERAAFSAKEGDITDPVLGLSGIVLLQVDHHLPGATVEGNTVDVRMIQIPYHLEPTAVDKQRARAGLGQVDVAIRSNSLMQYLPGILRTNSDAPKVQDQTAKEAEEKAAKAKAEKAGKGDGK